MSDSPPPKKRPRLSEHSPSPSSAPPPPTPLDAFKRDAEFWIEDGNLILIANQDTAFRVYRGLLAAQSTVFADMLTAASSDPAQLTVDGCLVLEVSDTPEELAYFLNVLLPKSEPVFHHPPNDPLLTFDHVAAVIRLAHKYNVKDVESQGIALLQESQFPIYYLIWEERDLHPTMTFEDANAIGAVNLARLTGAVALLPMAIYGCIALGSAVVDGWERDDGVVEHLSQEDLKICMEVREALARKAAVAFGRAFETPCESCTTQTQCLSGLRTARRDIFREHFADHLALDPWDPDLASLLDGYGLCVSCEDAVYFRELDERNKIWDMLPKMLGIKMERNSAVASPMSSNSPTAGEEACHSPPLDPVSSSAGSLSGSLAGIKRHAEFWLDDGNLILVANNDTAFRIYAGLLASQSDVFAGLFEVASSCADELYDGCPVVPVHDAPGQFAHLLRVLMPKNTRNFYRTSRDPPLTFDHAAAVVHLANKYCLPAVREQALNIIVEHAFTSDRPRPLKTLPNLTLIVEDIHAIGAVNIARLLGKPKLLLPALYRCAVLGSAVLDGWTRDDGVVEYLTPADLKLCIDARAALARENVTIFSATFLDKPHKQCADPDKCIAGLRKLEDAMLRGGELGRDYDVAGGQYTDLAQRATAAGVCERCRGTLRNRADALREGVWKRLPQIFDIEVEGWR